MKYFGDKDFYSVLNNHLMVIAKNNAAFAMIYNILLHANLDIYVSTEQDLLNDSRNKSMTLTEFRCYQLGSSIYLFNTRYETMDSMVFNFLHELCHSLIRSNQLTTMMAYVLNGAVLNSAGKEIDLSKPYWMQNGFEELIKYDDVHDDLPEEKICNWFAESIMGKNYDRKWWRKNIEKLDKSA